MPEPTQELLSMAADMLDELNEVADMVDVPVVARKIRAMSNKSVAVEKMAWAVCKHHNNPPDCSCSTGGRCPDRARYLEDARVAYEALNK